MTFGEKLKKLRNDKQLTQDELAQILYVSRTAVSKWESGRGFPNIESLKTISEYFFVTVDDLLSCDELINLAKREQYRKEMHLKNIIFGALDCCMSLLFFLPFFAQEVNGVLFEVPLHSLNHIQPYLKIIYFVIVILNITWGLLIFALQICEGKILNLHKISVSLMLSTIAVAVFIISRQPYAAVFVFMFLIIKVIMLIKRK